MTNECVYELQGVIKMLLATAQGPMVTGAGGDKVPCRGAMIGYDESYAMLYNPLI